VSENAVGCDVPNENKFWDVVDDIVLLLLDLEFVKVPAS
jgi:hypothetical protein